MSDLLERLCDLLDEAGATVTFSAFCRSGVIGDLWRCLGEPGPTGDEALAERDAELVRRAMRFQQDLDGWLSRTLAGDQAGDPAVPERGPSTETPGKQ